MPGRKRDLSPGLKQFRNGIWIRLGISQEMWIDVSKGRTQKFTKEMGKGFMILALETEHLGKRYGKKWAIHNCSLQIPGGCMTGLVGPNGAGKTTLLHVATGLLAPTSGTVKVLGHDPSTEARRLLPKIGFVAQEHPLYKTFRVEEMLTLGRKLNTTWDQNLALGRLKRLGIPLHQPISKLSGGQQAQVALILALAKRPALLFLDEPVASLDPLARHEFQETLKGAVKEERGSVIISSHNVADLERFCNYLVILSAAHVQLCGPVDRLLQYHKVLVGPLALAQDSPGLFTVIASSEIEDQCTLLVHLHSPVVDQAWKMRDASLEEIILAYLSHPDISMAEAEAKKVEVL